MPIENRILSLIEVLKGKLYNMTYSSGGSYLDLKELPKDPEVFSIERYEEIFASTISILTKLYGENHSHVGDLEIKVEKYRNYPYPEKLTLKCCLGKLNAIETDIKYGLLTSIEKEINGEIIGDFIKLAKASIAEGQKNIAAVLACAALEDALKKIGKFNGVLVEDKTMIEVVNALKSKGLIKGTQGQLLSAFGTLRNKTFHAEWDKVEEPEVKSLISFAEEMIIKHFS